MTGPRKRTFLSVALLLAALLVGGTARSTEAARRKPDAPKKSHSKQVKKNGHQQNSKTKKSSESRDHQRQRVEAKARPAKLKQTVSKKQPAKTAQSRLATQQAHSKTLVRPLAKTPRAKVALVKTARTPSTAPKQAAKPKATATESRMPEALLRRQAWAQPRRTLLKPAKVQDPPAFVAVKRSTEESPRPVTRPSAEPVRMASASVDTSQDLEPNEDLVREALQHRGKPYVWGGASRGGFDCSGLVLYVFRKKRGLSLPHSASAQARMGTSVAREDLQPGDLVFFSGTYRSGISHVGIYIGENKIVHAANQRRNVRIDSLTGYYSRKYWGARRLTKTPVRFTREELREIAPDASELPDLDE